MSSSGVAGAADDVDEVEGDGFPGVVGFPRGRGVVAGEVVGGVAVGAPWLEASGAG